MTSSAQDFEARVAHLDDERLILDALYRYAHAIDYGLEDDWIDCFTEDGMWETRRGPMAATGAANHRRCGRAEFREQWKLFSHPPRAWNKHMLVEPRIEIDGDRCRVDSYVIVPSAHRTGAYIRAFGRYRDRLVRCPDGRWRIEERICEVDGTHPLTEPAGGPDVSQSLAIEEIKRLKARYCHLLDAKQWSEWSELFTENAQVWIGPEEDRVIEGRLAILARISGILAQTQTVHEAALPDIEITGPTSAQGTWGTFSIIAAGSNGDVKPSKHRWGRQEERYERGTDDRWRIQSLRNTLLRVEQG